jgi:Flp pilus assembly pilin Flp
MLRNFLKNRKAQNTAEYALLIALVVAGIIAMQTYAQRALQARIHDASVYMSSSMGTINGYTGATNTTQYEPYYLNQQYTVNTQGEDDTRQGQNTFAYSTNMTRSRLGNQVDTYNTADMSQTQ